VKKGFHWHKLKERREWRYFIKENRKLVQSYDDHPEKKKTHIQNEEIEGYILVLNVNKVALVRGGHQGNL
jgi:hypothetical protein